MVEVNSTFYSVPDRELVRRWCAHTPDDLFSMSSYINCFHFIPPGEVVAARAAERKCD